MLLERRDELRESISLLLHSQELLPNCEQPWSSQTARPLPTAWFAVAWEFTWGEGLGSCIITMLPSPFLCFQSVAPSDRRWGNSSGALGMSTSFPRHLVPVSGKRHLAQCSLSPTLSFGNMLSCSWFKEVDAWTPVCMGLPSCREVVEWGHASTPGSTP